MSHPLGRLRSFFCAATDPLNLAVRLTGVRDLLTQSQVDLQPGEVLQLDEVSRSTLPEDYHRAPLQRELLAEFQADGATQQ